MILIIQYWKQILCAVFAVLFGLYCYQCGRSAVQAKWDASIIEQKDDARPKIIDAGREYAKIRDKIIYIKGDNGLAGHRTELAIDSLP